MRKLNHKLKLNNDSDGLG